MPAIDTPTTIEDMIASTVTLRIYGKRDDLGVTVAQTFDPTGGQCVVRRNAEELVTRHVCQFHHLFVVWYVALPG